MGACQASVAVCLRSGRCSCEAELCGCRVALSAAAWGLSWVGGLSLRWRQLDRQRGAVGSSGYFTVMVAFYVNEFLFSSNNNSTFSNLGFGIKALVSYGRGYWNKRSFDLKHSLM